MEDMGFFIIFGVIFIGFFGFRFYQKQMIAEAWEEAAQSMGLRFNKGGLFGKTKILGNYRGRAVEAWIRSEQRRSGQHSTTIHYTVFQAGLSNPDWMGVKISRRGFGAKVASFFGGQDIEIGDSSFDKAYRIQGDLTENAKSALMRSEVQSEIRGLSSAFGSFVLEGGTVRVENQERVRDASRLQRYIERVVDRAANLDSALSESGGAREARSGEDLFPAVEPSRVPIPQETGNNEPLW